jgi:predicted enzyme related to lactoylglutathione lyase
MTVQQVTGPRQLHEFCWINMLTKDMEAEQKFFADLFDWTYGDIPGMGFTIKVQKFDIGGLFDLDHPNTPKGLPAHIGMRTFLSRYSRSHTQSHRTCFCTSMLE